MRDRLNLLITLVACLLCMFIGGLAGRMITQNDQRIWIESISNKPIVIVDQNDCTVGVQSALDMMADEALHGKGCTLTVVPSPYPYIVKKTLNIGGPLDPGPIDGIGR